jgi:hypothetical protein
MMKSNANFTRDLAFNFNLFIFFLFNFISFLKKDEKKYIDLILFLKKIFNLFDEGDFLFFIDNFSFFDSNFKNFLYLFSTNKDIVFGLKFLFLFINSFYKRYNKFGEIFKKNSQLNFAVFFDNCLASEKLISLRSLDKFSEVCADFGNKMMKIIPLLLKNVRLHHKFLLDLNVESYIFGVKQKSILMIIFLDLLRK